MSMWARIKEWFARPDPMDAESSFFPDSNPPPPDGFFIPGPSARFTAPMPGDDHGRTDPAPLDKD